MRREKATTTPTVSTSFLPHSHNPVKGSYLRDLVAPAITTSPLPAREWVCGSFPPVFRARGQPYLAGGVLQHAFLYSGGSITDPGTLGGSLSSATSRGKRFAKALLAVPKAEIPAAEEALSKLEDEKHKLGTIRRGNDDPGGTETV